MAPEAILVMIGAGIQTKSFARFANGAHIGDFALCAAVREVERGLIAANLGGGVKQRIARPGQGKSGGFRTLIVFRTGTRAFFAHGFAKNERDNIGKYELAAVIKLASELLAYDDRPSRGWLRPEHCW